MVPTVNELIDLGVEKKLCGITYLMMMKWADIVY
jgi:hypothetical protein